MGADRAQQNAKQQTDPMQSIAAPIQAYPKKINPVKTVSGSTIRHTVIAQPI